jgi:hypothetical protein
MCDFADLGDSGADVMLFRTVISGTFGETMAFFLNNANFLAENVDSR